MMIITGSYAAYPSNITLKGAERLVVSSRSFHVDEPLAYL